MVKKFVQERKLLEDFHLKNNERDLAIQKNESHSLRTQLTKVKEEMSSLRAKTETIELSNENVASNDDLGIYSR